MYCGDYLPGDTIDFKFTTIRPSTGAPFTLAGTPVLSVYKNNSTTQTTTGVTLTVDFDAVTGLNHVRIVTSDAFYVAGDNYDVVITTGTVDSVSAVGYVVGRFSLAKVAALRPTTAGRTLDVSAGGEAGIDLANVGSPNTTLSFSTTGSVGSVNGNVAGSVNSVVGTVTANTTQWGGVAVTGMPMPTYTQPTGFLAATFPGTVASTTNITGGTITTVTNVTNGVTVATNNDKTGYSLTQSFPTNFAALGINSSGHLSRVTLVDTCTTNTDMRGTDNAALAASWTATRAGYLDSVLIAANANQRTVQVNGNGHVASVLHSSEPDSIVVGAFATGSITAAALASDAATEIATATLGATVEGSETLQQTMRLVRAATVGKLSGAAGTTVTMRDAADSKNRITATVDADGNRLSVSTDAT